MSQLTTNAKVICTRNNAAIGGLKLKDYTIESVSMAGYIWLVEPTHLSGRIGPYVPSRFEINTNPTQ